jgi:hypothetical protein
MPITSCALPRPSDDSADDMTAAFLRQARRREIEALLENIRTGSPAPEVAQQAPDAERSTEARVSPGDPKSMAVHPLW